MAETAAVARRNTVKDLVALPAYRQRFEEVLGPERTRHFLGALVAYGAARAIAELEPKSVLGAAFTAATLDLPIEKNLGLSWIVPYKGVAQFQIGWRGYVQLALRSGQYRRLNAFRVNAEAYQGRDEMGEPLIDMGALDETRPAVGYCVAWTLLNGFTKRVYWSREKCLAHGQRYSQAYRSGKKDTPWQTHTDEMCLKTVVANGLRTWGPLSVQMQTAFGADQGIVQEPGAEPVFFDNPEEGGAGEPEPVPTGTATARLEKRLGRSKAAPTPAPVVDAGEDLLGLCDEVEALAQRLGWKQQKVEYQVSEAVAGGAAALRALIARLQEDLRAAEASG